MIASHPVELSRNNGPKPPIRALILDDDSFDRQRLRRMIAALPMQVDADAVSTLDDLRDMVARRAYDLVFLDFGLQGGTGLDALSIVSNSSKSEEVACIMVTNENRGDIAAACFRKGCQDFIPKSDLSPETLSTAFATIRRSFPADVDAQPQDMTRRIGEILAPALELAMREAMKEINIAENRNLPAFSASAFDDEMAFVFRDADELTDNENNGHH